MKVGILGSGDVGRALGAKFAALGHEVKIGTRDVKKKEVADWLKGTKGKVSAGSFSEAAAHGEIVVLCTNGAGAENAVELAGEKNLGAKVLIDVTNPLDFSKGMPPGLFVGTSESLAERIQAKLPKAKVVKAFNIVGNAQMVNPKMKDGTPTMIVAGNDAGAKEKVSSVLKEFGWDDVVDAGDLAGARWLEAWVPLWVRVCEATGSWNVAIRILRK
ncbi:MAG TPA: NAD(P)-binding domain-containing protein [Thermoplasmata archaeon]|nr:NAD(P)-binding domain-containing protein [Thermoplasmata archaeon]